MQSSTVALNRFGLGARPTDQPPEDPRRWLLQQLDRFDPRPQALAQVPARSSVVAQLGDYLTEQQMAARDRRQIQPASMPTAAPQQGADPQADSPERSLRQSL